MSTLYRAFWVLALTSLTGVVTAQSGVQVRAVDGLLSVQANNVSAAQLATELSEQLGISIVVTGDIETPVNLDIVDEPLEKALGKLSPNHMLVKNKDSSEILEVVLMMGEGSDSSSGAGVDQFLPSGSPAEEIIDEQAFEQDPDQFDQGQMMEGQAAEARATMTAPPDTPVYIPDTPMYTEEGLPIDPATGLPYEQ